MKTSVRLRPARPNEASVLSSMAMVSKAYWGYSAEFIEACHEELSVSSENLASDKFSYFVAESDGERVGYYALKRVSDSEYELDALFVVPEKIRTGIGRRLIEHAKKQVVTSGGSCLLIQGDPNATEFYLAAGCRLVGQRESQSIPGRYLPLFIVNFEQTGG